MAVKIYSVWYRLGYSDVSNLFYSLEDAQHKIMRVKAMGATHISLQVPRDACRDSRNSQWYKAWQEQYEQRCVAAYVSEGLGE
ncbi:MAG: hypothetical protein E6Q97_32630 [Desulfurellales bacterium]|nr:MAG: hypothetical protein E6Q97_32630 [Desulfurellales bacterium]